MSAFLPGLMLLTFIACNSDLGQTAESGKPRTEAPEVSVPADGFITGVVMEIQQGKDGYTAQIKTPSGEEYFATISRANLTDPASFHAAQPGDTLRVKGDAWEMENQQHITVRELK